MAKAVWNGIVIAESDTYETVEGNVYFPEAALKREFFRPSTTTSTSTCSAARSSAAASPPSGQSRKS